ncbi:MAG: SURF1 family protein [Acidimicrobiales bacterium]
MSWRFARTPKWIVRHLLVVVLVIVMVQLGLWQLRRLDDRQAHNALVESRQAEPSAAVEDLVPPGAAVGSRAVDDVVHRLATARGAYEPEDTVVVENRTLNGASGGWVLTPLRFDDGRAVLVNRGFIGFDADGRIIAPDPPGGRVQVDGIVLPSQEREGLGAADPSEGTLDVLVRVDLERFAAQVDYDVLPAYLQLQASDPPEATAPAGSPQLVALDPPELGEGPHLSYAVQWFIFTTIAAGGYLLLLRKLAIEEATLRSPSNHEGPGPRPDGVTEVASADR